MFNYSVKVYPFENPKGKMVAFADLVIDDFFCVKGFKIFNGAKGLFVSPPSKQGKDKEGNDKWFDDVVFFEEKADGELQGPNQKEIFGAILEAYEDGGKNKTATTQTTRAKTAATQAEKVEKPAGKAKRPAW